MLSGEDHFDGALTTNHHQTSATIKKAPVSLSVDVSETHIIIFIFWVDRRTDRLDGREGNQRLVSEFFLPYEWGLFKEMY